jgi:hypothetical protein
MTQHERRRRGSGMTQRFEEYLPLNNSTSATSVKQTLERAAEHATFEGWIREPEMVARDILSRAKRDESGALILIEDDTPQHYAERILALTNKVRGMIEHGVAADAAYLALKLGYLICQADMKFEHEPTWITGRKVREPLETARNKANDKRRKTRQVEHDRWRGEAQAIWGRNPALRAKAVARRIKSKYKIPDHIDTIARNIRPLKKS